MWAHGEARVARFADPETVGVGDGVGGGDQGGFVGRVPVGHEECLGFEEIGVGAGEDL